VPIEVVMPRLGWTMEAGTVVEWLKESGESVEEGDLLFSVESDKAITDVEALDAGVLHLPADAPIGVEVPVGATVGYILAPGEAAPESSGELAGVASAASQEPVAASAASAGPAPASGGVDGAGKAFAAVSPRARRVAAELGVDLAQVTGTGRGGRIREADVRAVSSGSATAANGTRPRVSPSVRKLAEAQGIDLSAAPASRPGGRVLRADLAVAATPREAPSFDAVPMSATRRAISQRMAESAQSVAAVTLTTEVDATELARMRETLKGELAGTDERLPSYNDLLIRLVARALCRHPEMNAALDGDRILVHKDVHVGLAVDTERGLLVPVVRHADRLGVFDIAGETARLIEATRDGSADRETLSGGTFTITNLGMFEIDAFTPIINLPECAVLGVGRIVPKPVVVDEASETIAVRKMMALSLTFDHRVVDGAPAARFLQTVKGMIEHPVRWLM
jgi:pyruvate dehydrogenase E2 component (dihydrolipoamide acetyltransferase)